MQASRPRNTHTTAAIKLPCITLTVNFRPSHSRLRYCKPTGYHMTCHGVARQGEDGRTHHHFISLISLISLMQASRPRCPHTPAVIKLPAYPCGNSSPEPNHRAASKPTGYPVTPPYTSHKSHNSHNSHASVTPSLPAYPRSYQTKKAPVFQPAQKRASAPQGRMSSLNSSTETCRP